MRSERIGIAGKTACLLLMLSCIPAYAEITRQPYLQPTEDMETSVVVAWRTAEKNGGKVYFGIRGAEEHAVEGVYDGQSSDGKHCYHARLIGLAPGKVHRYRVASDGTETPAHMFTTSSHADDFAFRALLITDTHFEPPGGRQTNTMNFRKALPEFLAFEPNLVLHMGDLPLLIADAGAYESMFLEGKELWSQAVLCPIAGNHDGAKDVTGDADFRLFAEQFYLPTNGPEPAETEYAWLKEVIGSFDFGGIHFVTYGAGYGTISDKSLKDGPAWLRADLRRAADSGRVANIIFRAHHGAPPVALASEFDGALNVTGHAHTYARSFPVLPGGASVGEKEDYGPDARGLINVILPGTAWAGTWVPPKDQIITEKTVGYAEMLVSKGGRRIEITVYAKPDNDMGAPRRKLDHFVIERDIRKRKAPEPKR